MKTNHGIAEATLQGYCSTYFRSKGFLTREEVPFLFKIADIFCFHEETGECVAVEVKVSKWRQALKQAIVYQMMADKVYIALLYDHVRAVDQDLLVQSGVGLLGVHTAGGVEEIIPAPISPRRMGRFVSAAVATAFPDIESSACLLI